MNASSRYRKPVFITSASEVYERSTEVPFSEDEDLLIGLLYRRRSGYAWSEASDEFLAMAYWHYSPMLAVIVGLSDTKGPR